MARTATLGALWLTMLMAAGPFIVVGVSLALPEENVPLLTRMYNCLFGPPPARRALHDAEVQDVIDDGAYYCTIARGRRAVIEAATFLEGTECASTFWDKLRSDKLPKWLDTPPADEDKLASIVAAQLIGACAADHADAVSTIANKKIEQDGEKFDKYGGGNPELIRETLAQAMVKATTVETHQRFGKKAARRDAALSDKCCKPSGEGCEPVQFYPAAEWAGSETVKGVEALVNNARDALMKQFRREVETAFKDVAASNKDGFTDLHDFLVGFTDLFRFLSNNFGDDSKYKKYNVNSDFDEKLLPGHFTLTLPAGDGPEALAAKAALVKKLKCEIEEFYAEKEATWYVKPK